jgi:hypothetical protein
MAQVWTPGHPGGVDTGHRHERRGAEAVDTKLEVVVVPVTDVDRVKNFYQDERNAQATGA